MMNDHNIRHLPVLDSKKKVIGIVSERDVYFSYQMHANKTFPFKKS